MPNIMIRVYDELTKAESARKELLNAGFDPDNIALESNLEEAGPVAANGMLDERDDGGGPPGSKLQELLGAEERTGAYNNSTPIWRGNIIMKVATGDASEEAKAGDIMERFGAIDPEARIQGRIH